MIRELDGANEGRVIKLEVKPEDPKEVDTAQPILDFPIAAIRSPRDSRRTKQPDPHLRPGQTDVSQRGRHGRSDRARLDRRRAVPVPDERPNPRVLARAAVPQGTGGRHVHRHARAGRLWRGLLRRPQSRSRRAGRRPSGARPGQAGRARSGRCGPRGRQTHQCLRRQRHVRQTPAGDRAKEHDHRMDEAAGRASVSLPRHTAWRANGCPRRVFKQVEK